MANMIQRHEHNKRWHMKETILFSEDDVIKFILDTKILNGVLG